MARRVTFEQAKAKFVHRYTGDHVPAWARTPHFHTEAGRELYYAPQFRSDREWYDNTVFPGEPGVHGNSRHCLTSGQTWPFGQWLTAPFKSPAHPPPAFTFTPRAPLSGGAHQGA